jgi:hypothetical protein
MTIDETQELKKEMSPIPYKKMVLNNDPFPVK